MDETQWQEVLKRLVATHTVQGNFPASPEMSDSVVCFPLLNAVEECYRYEPLLFAGATVTKHQIEKSMTTLSFLVICFPSGYVH